MRAAAAPYPLSVRRLGAGLFLGLLWLHSGALFFVQAIGPKDGELFLYGATLVVTLVLVTHNLGTGRVLPTGVGPWTRYLLAFFLTTGLITAVTALYLEKSPYQIARVYYGYSYFVLVPYIVFTARIPLATFVRTLFAITGALALLGLLTLATGVQLYATTFLDFEPFAVEGLVAGSVRIMPYGFYAAIFGGTLALLCLNTPRAQARFGSRRLLYAVLAAGAVVPVLTFSRSLIGAVGIVWVLLVGRTLFRHGMRVSQMVIPAVLALVLVAVNDALMHGALLSALGERFSRGLELGDGWRMLELLEAWASISAHPLIGIGLGSEYTHLMASLAGSGYATNANYDIHNSFASILIAYGACGLLLIAWGAWRYLTLRAVPGSPAALVLGAAKGLLLVGLIQGFFSGPFFNGYNSFWFALFLSYALWLRSETTPSWQPTVRRPG